MNSYDDFTATAQTIFDNACRATGDFVNTSRLRIERMNLSAELERSYAKLGKLSYNMTKNGVTESDAVNEIIARIDSLLKKIEDITDRINSMQQ